MPAPPPTARLLRAVAAERDELERHRARMTDEAAELRRTLARIERGLLEIDERSALLDRLLPMHDDSPERNVTTRRPANARARDDGVTARRHADVRGRDA